MTVQSGAQVSVTNSNAISLGDNATITLEDNSLVSNNATSGNGQWSAGNNTIEFGSNGRLTVGVGASILANGTQNNGEPINVMGVGNVITNRGTISSRNGAAIWFEDRVTGGTNTIDNYGTVRTQLGANANVIGNQSNGSVTFINRTGARVEGSLSFAGGSDNLTLEAGSVITGSFNGGGGTNTLTLGGGAGSSDSLAGDIRNFQTLTKTGEGRWTLTGAVGANGGNAALQMFVNQGTLALTGNNANFNGSVTVNPTGTLEARAQSLPPSIIDNGLVRFAQDNAGTYSGIISGSGAVEKVLGGDLTLAGANSYSGGTTINAGTVFISSDANLGAASGGLTLNGGALGVTADFTTARATTLGPLGGTFIASGGATLTHDGAIAGPGLLTKNGAGTVILNGGNSYAGGTAITAGVLQVSSDANLGAAGGTLTLAGGTLRTAADMTTARSTLVEAAGGTVETVAGTTLTHDGVLSGPGILAKTGAGTLVLSGSNSQGGLAINGGVVQVSSDANLGAAGAALSFDSGTLRVAPGMTVGRATTLNAGGGTIEAGGDRNLASDFVTFSGPITGAGGLTKTGSGSLFLTGTSSYAGDTAVAGGSLFVSGDLSGVTGTTRVRSDARISGNGVLGGNLVIEDGGWLTAGDVPGDAATLTVGNLTLNNNSQLFLNIIDTSVGGAFNDLINVNGDLVLDGQLKVLEQGQDLGAGVYRVFNYGGALTDNGLDITGYASIDGTVTRPLTGFSVQTVVPGQVNLINTTGLSLNYWDGSAIANKNNNVIEGGDGNWFHAGPDSTFAWTDPNGAVNASWADGQFAIFIGAPGTVTASNADGQITTSGMQFGVGGYLLQGDPLLLVGSPDAPGETTIRVGDGTAAGAAMAATISAPLTGGTLLRKTDAGTLILTGANDYAGGTRIEGGAIEIASDSALGAAGSGLTLDGGTLRTVADIGSGRPTTLGAGGGTFDTVTGTTLTLNSAISGAGILRKSGAGTLLLLADSGHGGGTIVNAGMLQLGNGGTAGGITGPVINNGVLRVDRSNQIVLDGAILGSGSLEQAGSGTTILAANNLYTGTTTISAGTLQLGNGGTAGNVAGPIVDNATLAINRSDDFTLASTISGTGALVHTGTGRTVLTGANSYAGGTTVASGRLYIDGNQSAATGAAVAMSGTRLGGSGVIGGDVSILDGATLSPGPDSLAPGTLTINGNLGLNPGSTLLYNITSTVVGGAGNDLTTVGGNLVLDGTINVVDQSQTLGPGVYRIFNYAGTLTDNGLTIGGYTSDGTTITRPLSDFIVQTVIPSQVNLINTSGNDLNYWDGSAIANKNNNVIEGGDGTWFHAGPDALNSWTDPAGAVNAPWADSQFAIFLGAPGTVTASNADGQIRASGMQFGVSGYLLQGDPIELVGSPDAPGEATVRVGDGTAAGAGITATISAPLVGNVLLNKTDAGTLLLTGVNSYTGGTRIQGGVIEIGTDTALGTPDSRLTLDGGTLRMTASLVKTRPITLGTRGGTFDTVAGTTTEIQTAIDGGGALGKVGDGTLILLNDNSYTGGTTINAGTLQIGNGGTTGHIVGDIVNNSRLVINRSDTKLTPGVISGTGQLIQAGTGTTVLQANNSYTGGTIISAGTLQIGDGGTTGHVVGDILNNSRLVINRSDTKLTPAIISGTGQLIQAGTGVTVLQADNSYTGGTTINAGTLQIGDGGTVGSIVGDVTNNSILAFNRADEVTFAGAISGPGSVQHLGSGKTILTGANVYTGGTTVAAGTLQVGNGGTTGQIFGDILNNGTVILDRADDILYGGAISGTGSTVKNGAGALFVTGTGTYTGGTVINQGTLQLGIGGTSGSIIGDIVDNAALVVNRSDSLLFNGVISGTGRFEQAGTGTTVFEADNSYTGGTLISAGTLQVGNGGTTGLVPGDVVNNGRLVINRSNTKVLEGIVSGTGEVVQAGLGTLIINNANSYSGGTAVEAGILQISSDANLGAAVGGLRLSNGTLRTTADMTTARETVIAQGGGTIETLDGTTLTHDGLLDGAGALTKSGGGTLLLSGANSYAGPTLVSAGTLRVNGDQSAATGLTTVASGATLGGSGTIGGGVTIADGATLSPGAASMAPGTLTIAGDLALSSGALLAYEFGQANVPGGPLNDLVDVGGNLVLDGTINVTVPAGGSFDPGLYRVFNYAGGLTDNGLAIGTIPSSSYYVQTSIAGQVNLVNTAGLTLDYWDGAAGPKNDGIVNGGNGVWQASAGNDNWTTGTGSPNAPFSDGAFAIFSAAPGTVSVDASLGPVNVSGMQFASDGYLVQGDPVTLTGANATIRVGDGSAAGAGMTATINAELTGSAGIVKSDLGTLILNGANSYAGGTQVNGGVLQVASDANLGAASGGLSLDGGTLRTTADLASGRGVTLGAAGGTFETLGGTTFSLAGDPTGPGSLTKTGTGTLLLTGDGSYTGGTTISSGMLQLGDGGTSGSIVGDVVNNAALLIDRSDAVTLGGAISGVGSLTQAGSGTTILTGDNSYTGGTTIAAGTLQLGNGGTSGGIVGDVANNGTLAFNRSDTVPFAGAISGSGAVTQAGIGTTVLTAANSYSGGTTISAGTLQLGDGGTSGSIVGNVANNGTLAFNRSDAVSFGGTISGTGALAQIGAGATILTADNSYTGGTTIAAGTLQLGDGGSSGGIVGDVVNNGILAINRGDAVTLPGAISGTGALAQIGTGTTILTADNSYTGGTMIAAGALQLGNGGTSGGIVGDVANNGTLIFNRSDQSSFDGSITGTGGLVKSGSGTTILTANNSYAGETRITEGFLYVNGDQSAATGATSVANGARLAGNGIVGGDVTIADGGTLAPGFVPLTPATLTINGDLGLSPGAILFYNMVDTSVGGPLNDLTVVHGDLTLDGVVNLLDQGQALDPGVYRVFNYDGALIDNGLAIGSFASSATTPTRPLTGFSVQTAIAGQVNLVNSAGLTLTYWDGEAGPKNDGVINGGAGVWRRAASGDSLNWTDPAGAINAPWTDAGFAIFTGTPGTVTVSGDNGQVQASGMQFQSDGYVVQGAPIELVGGESVIRVGDGTAAGSVVTAAIDAPLIGGARLVKSDLGTLILTGANGYAGGTQINGGVLQVASDTNLGAASGGLGLDGGSLRTTADIASGRGVTLGAAGGTFETLDGTTLTLASAVTGPGGLVKSGGGTLLVAADSSYTGGTTIGSGTLQLGNGGASGGIIGDVVNNGTLAFDRSDSMTFAGVISGAGALAQIGSGTTILTADNSYTGGTTIAAGTLQLGNGGTSGGIVGDVANNGTLAFDRSDAVTFAGTISGTGAVTQAGTGTTILTAANSYSGGTTISAGTLQLGDGGTSGSIVGNVANNGTLAFNRSDVVSFGGAISGTGALAQIGAGATILTADNSYTGGTTIAAGTLQLGDGGSSGGIVGDVTNNGVLIFDRSNALTFAGAISGAGAVTQAGAGTTTLTAANSYSGGTMISAGTLQLGDGGTSGSIVGDVVNDGTLAFNRADAVSFAGTVSGTGALVQAGTGTTILTADNNYTGGTTISAGRLQLGDGGTSGGVVGDVINNGTLAFDRSDAVTFAGVISGTGAVTQVGAGTTILTAANSYTGGTTISAGTLQLGDGGTSGSIVGNVANNGTLAFNRSDALIFDGTISGTGALAQIGAGATILTADNSYTGGTTIAAGTLQLGNGGTSGGIVGDVVDNGTLAFNRADLLRFTGAVSGTGSLVQAGPGTAVLTAANSYAGPTTVSAGALYVSGDQSAARGGTSVNAATLGGIGTIGGDVSFTGGTLAPGDTGIEPGTLRINGNLGLSAGTTLDYSFGQANVPGGPFNDLVRVGGDLVLDGTLDVTVSPGGSFDPGLYRIVDYGGALTDNGLAIGSLPSGDFFVQTSIAQQVNLVNATGLTLNFWDGGSSPKADGQIEGGSGVWHNGAGSDNWTQASGTVNAPWDGGAFAIFSAAPGTVTIDNGNGQVQAAGMQFASSGYVLDGGPLALTGSGAAGGDSIIRVGDGSSAGSGYVATIAASLTGDAALVKTDLGTLILTGANGYTGGTRIMGGVLQVGGDANLGGAGGGLLLDSGTLRTTVSFTTPRAVTLGTGGGTFNTAGETALTLGGAVGGAGQLTKTGTGTLILQGSNSYGGGTAIDGGTVQISADAALGAATGGVTFSDGTLRTTADLTSERVLTFTGAGTIRTDSGTTFTLNGSLAGAGSFVKADAGTLLLAGDSSGYAGSGEVAGGTLAVQGSLGGTLAVGPAGRLEGIGRTGSVTNAGTVAPGRGGIGTLTIAGDYSGADGTLEIEATLGDDASPADRLVVTGATAGATRVSVINRDGIGGATREGIKIVDVGGASNGSFTLQGDYQFQGQPAIIAGAFGYRLYKNGVADPADGDWYLRSSLLDPGAPPPPDPPPVPPPPLYQPGVPVYEAYPQMLLAMNGLPTLQQRVGNRSWSAGPIQGSGIWGRFETSRDRPVAAFSTAMADRDVDRWQLQAGTDVTLARRGDGSTLIAGIAGHYGEATSHVRSVYGDGKISGEGYGVSASLTWYGPQGFYIDGQAKFSWYRSDLESSLLDRLTTNNHGSGKAFSVEAGKRSPVGGGLSLTPQIQMVYSTVDFDRFTDPAGASVSRGLGNSLKTRWGISLDYQSNETQARRTHVYGIANLTYEWLDGTRVDVSGTPIANQDQRLWAEMGVGGSLSWNDQITLYTEVSGSTALKDFADGYGIKAVAGLRIGF
ncbi:MAG: autotransporter-associated beta strand repeat-containing protein [Sphingobium sp.]|nr:autotransporter-associated beta strand repeat-containing protein [Sphingobium sp.]